MNCFTNPWSAEFGLSFAVRTFNAVKICFMFPYDICEWTKREELSYAIISIAMTTELMHTLIYLEQIISRKLDIIKMLYFFMFISSVIMLFRDSGIHGDCSINIFIYMVFLCVI